MDLPKQLKPRSLPERSEWENIAEYAALLLDYLSQSKEVQAKGGAAVLIEGERIPVVQVKRAAQGFATYYGFTVTQACQMRLDEIESAVNAKRAVARTEGIRKINSPSRLRTAETALRPRMDLNRRGGTKALHT